MSPVLFIYNFNLHCSSLYSPGTLTSLRYGINSDLCEDHTLTVKVSAWHHHAGDELSLFTILTIHKQNAITTGLSKPDAYFLTLFHELPFDRISLAERLRKIVRYL